MRATTAYVAVRDLPRLRVAVHTSRAPYATIAARIGISKQRMSQILSGTTRTVPVATATALEDVVNVRRGTLFTLPDGDLARPYVDGNAA